MLPAVIAVRPITGKEWRANEHKIAEMAVMEGEAIPEEKGVPPECEVVESITGETLAGEGCADKAVPAWNERAPASDHAAMEIAAGKAAATEMHGSAAKPSPVETAAKAAAVKAAAAKAAAVKAAAAKAAAMEAAAAKAAAKS